MPEATAGVYRPSPRPRPAAAGRPDSPHLHVVPVGTSEVPTSGNPAEAPTETISAGQSGSLTVEAESGFRVRVAAAFGATRDYWTPPAVFVDPPASLADLATYAKQAPWTAQQTGIIRAFGVGYYRFVGYPYTVVSRYREWILQRPLRLFTACGLVKLAAHTGPGIWIVDHLIYPAARLAGHIFL